MQSLGQPTALLSCWPLTKWDLGTLTAPPQFKIDLNKAAARKLVQTRDGVFPGMLLTSCFAVLGGCTHKSESARGEASPGEGGCGTGRQVPVPSRTGTRLWPQRE